jgi:uncharacterized sporulation protein YeaH/YhbH (DUF444 family)
MLRPLPDLENSEAMQKLGRASALRNARLDALHEMRDAVVRLQNNVSFDSTEIETIRDCLTRLEQVNELSK